eukprot:symbB.v1.2.000004.t1/scaffold5.1/size591573/4
MRLENAKSDNAGSAVRSNTALTCHMVKQLEEGLNLPEVMCQAVNETEELDCRWNKAVAKRARVPAVPQNCLTMRIFVNNVDGYLAGAICADLTKISKNLVGTRKTIRDELVPPMVKRIVCGSL